MLPNSSSTSLKGSRSLAGAMLMALSWGAGLYGTQIFYVVKHATGAPSLFSKVKHVILPVLQQQNKNLSILILVCLPAWIACPLACFFLGHQQAKIEKHVTDGDHDEDFSMKHRGADAAARSLLQLRDFGSSTIGTRDNESHPIQPQPTQVVQRERYLEMLVHHVSHTDLVLSLATGDGPLSEAQPVAPNKVLDHQTPRAGSVRRDTQSPHTERFCLCRPRFSAFDMYSRKVLDSIGKSSNSEILKSSVILFPRYERSDDTPRFAIVTPKPSRQLMLPTGIDLAKMIQNKVAVQPCDRTCAQTHLGVPWDELPDLRVRGRDVPRVEQAHHGRHSGDAPTLQLDAVLFPQLATLLPRWYMQIADKHEKRKKSEEVKKVVLLVTGVGTPRNWTHSIGGNSTKVCAELMERFINLFYPDVAVVRVHSETNIFRYDENITFAQQELMPMVNSYRDAHARGRKYPDEKAESMSIQERTEALTPTFNPDWKKTFSVTLSFGDGSPARTHAIQAALRPYRPTYFHFWQLKTFWHESKICDDDIEVHSFEDMETVPAMEISKTSSQVQMVVKEMQRFRQHFIETLLEKGNHNDIRQFWLRKTKKPVLAVLLVERPDGTGTVLHRGTNMEVSMPTGSLCAERNVIGTALASNPGLKREDLKMVAVLAVPLPDGNIAGANTGGGADSASEQLDELHQPDNMNRSMSFASFSSAVEVEQKGNDLSLQSSWVNMESADPPLPPSASEMQKKTASPPGTPVRKIKLFSTHEPKDDKRSFLGTAVLDKKSKSVMVRKQKRIVVVHSSEDINPLKPCGACNEWLKKISESNPYFKVITFTDMDCNGVYVSSCQE